MFKKKVLLPIYSKRAANSAAGIIKTFGREPFKISIDSDYKHILDRWKIKPDRITYPSSELITLGDILFKPRKIMLFADSDDLKRATVANMSFISFGNEKGIPLEIFFSGDVDELKGIFDGTRNDLNELNKPKNRIVSSNQKTLEQFLKIGIDNERLIKCDDPYLYLLARVNISLERQDDLKHMLFLLLDGEYSIRDEINVAYPFSQVFNSDAKTIMFLYAPEQLDGKDTFKQVIETVDELALYRPGINLMIICKQNDYGKVNKALNKVSISHANVLLLNLEDIIRGRIGHSFESLLYSSDAVIGNNNYALQPSRIFGKPTIGFRLKDDFKWINGEQVSVEINDPEILKIAIEVALSGKFKHGKRGIKLFETFGAEQESPVLI
ncbi:MAG: hypothetical protein WC501_01970 [Candidatus Micrarchaeia archaeon]